MGVTAIGLWFAAASLATLNDTRNRVSQSRLNSRATSPVPWLGPLGVAPEPREALMVLVRNDGENCSALPHDARFWSVDPRTREARPCSDNSQVHVVLQDTIVGWDSTAAVVRDQYGQVVYSRSYLDPEALVDALEFLSR